MKIRNVIAVIVAVLVPGLTALGQQQTGPQPDQPPPQPAPPAPALGTTNTPAPLPEPPSPPLPAGRAVSYGPLVGGMDSLSATNLPVTEEGPTDVNFKEVELPDAIRSLA